MVLKGLGFCDSTVSKVLEAFPNVLAMNEVEIRRKVEFLVGIDVPNVERFFHVFPEILGISIDSKLKPLLDEFIRIGFSKEEIKKEIF